ncbi:hypothetical protein K7432_018557 [Basidiobolus ranarum]|uniref:Condensation domain-containing protein n=1 Tax=Basidiobolus ranarum TaxID=34480 RepID=A0ABR2VIV9_9FUNG
MLSNIEEPTLPFGLADVHLDNLNVSISHCILSQELNERLRAQSKKFNVSVACLCHLAWGRVLACISDQQQVVFGTILVGRMQTGKRTDQTLGPFINTLPLRVDLSSSSVQDSVRQIHANLAELLLHEHAPLVLAQGCSGVPAGAPLFNALLNYRHTNSVSNRSNQICGIELSYLPERTTYPLTMDVDDFGTALGLTSQNVDPFDSTRVNNYMQKTLQSIVEALENTPQMPVYQLEVLPMDERELLLRSWNETATPYPEHQCIHQLFEDQALRDPTAAALVYEDQTLTD